VAVACLNFAQQNIDMKRIAELFVSKRKKHPERLLHGGISNA
jgi:hypothetical protein